MLNSLGGGQKREEDAVKCVRNPINLPLTLPGWYDSNRASESSDGTMW